MASRTKKRANLRDVAQKADVSVATVSRVLNSPQTVSKYTRKRVEDAIELLNFVPNAAARAINSGRTRIVGALVPTLDHSIFSRFLDALEEELQRYSLSLVVATTGGDPDIEAQQAEKLLNIGVEGLFVSGVTHSAKFEALANRRDLPVVATSYYDPDYHLPTVGYDNAQLTTMLLQHLIGLGHQSIGVLHGPPQSNDRTAARLSPLKNQHGVEVRSFETTFDLQSAGDAVEKVLRSPRPPTAFLCISDVLAHGALFRCQRLGISVPQEVAIAGIDDHPISQSTTPGITSVRTPVRLMGTRAAEVLATWVEKGERATDQLLESRLIIRGSTLWTDPQT